MRSLRSFLALGLAFYLLMGSLTALAQTDTLEAGVTIDEWTTILEEASPVVITSDAQRGVGKSAIFDASSSVLPDDYFTIMYNWDFGDGNSDQGIEVVHSYVEPGEYVVTLEVFIDGSLYAETMTDIFAYNQRFLLITDQAEHQERIESQIDFARERDIYVQLISSYDAASEFLVEEDLLQKLNESLSAIQDTQEIVVWTRGSTGLTVLSRLSKTLIDAATFRDKEVVVITDQSLSTIGNIAQGTFRTIDPAQMILTRPEALWLLFEEGKFDAFLEGLSTRGIEHAVITEEVKLSPLNFMSFLINYMVEKGVPSNSLLLILMLPVIVTIVAFFKQVIGLTTMGVYTPSIITLSFLALDIKFGLLIFVIILSSGAITRLFLRQYRLLYIPRMAILLTIVSLTILVLMLLGAYFDISQLVSISIFPMLIMSTMVEKFVNVSGERGLKPALVMIGSTTLVSVICYYVVEWAFLKTWIFGHPELIFAFLLVNIVLGRWTGLRLLEYVRFREIFRYAEEE